MTTANNAHINNSIYIHANEVALVMQVSRAYAYKVIKQLNTELEAKGYLTVNGRANRKYFYEQLYAGGM